MQGLLPADDADLPYLYNFEFFFTLGKVGVGGLIYAGFTLSDYLPFKHI